MSPSSAEAFTPESSLPSVAVQYQLKKLVDRVLSSRRSVRAAAEMVGQHTCSEQQLFLDSEVVNKPTARPDSRVGRCSLLAYLPDMSRRCAPSALLSGCSLRSFHNLSVELISRPSVEFAFNFCMFAPPALRVLALEEWQDWVVHLLERYDQGGVIDCIGEIRSVEEYRANQQSCCV